MPQGDGMRESRAIRAEENPCPGLSRDRVQGIVVSAESQRAQVRAALPSRFAKPIALPKSKSN